MYFVLTDRRFVEFERRKFDSWNWDDDLIVRADHIKLHDDVMEEHAGEAGGAFTDFANKRLQIHRIIPSCTQEEVLFSCCSELFVTL